MAGGAFFCRRRRLADSGKRVGDGRGAGEGGFCFATSLRVRTSGGGCRVGRPDDAGEGDPPARDSPRAQSTYARTPSAPRSLPRGRVWPSSPASGRRAAALFPCNPAAPCEVTRFAQFGPGATARTTPAAVLRAAPWLPQPARCHPLGRRRRWPPRDRANPGVGPESQSWAGAGRSGEEKLEKLGSLRSPSQKDQVGRRRLFFPGAGGGGRGTGIGPARPEGCLGGGRAWGRRRAGAVAAGAAGRARRAWGRGPRPPLQLPSVANRLHRSPPPPRGPSGGERPGVEWERVCVRVCTRRGAASARPQLGPACSPRPGGPFACPRCLPSSSSSSSILRARVCDGSPSHRPPVGDGFSWVEGAAAAGAAGAAGRRQRGRAPGSPGRRSGAGGRLVSGEMGDFLR